MNNFGKTVNYAWAFACIHTRTVQPISEYVAALSPCLAIYPVIGQL